LRNFILIYFVINLSTVFATSFTILLYIKRFTLLRSNLKLDRFGYDDQKINSLAVNCLQKHSYNTYYIHMYKLLTLNCLEELTVTQPRRYIDTKTVYYLTVFTMAFLWFQYFNHWFLLCVRHLIWLASVQAFSSLHLMPNKILG